VDTIDKQLLNLVVKEFGVAPDRVTTATRLEELGDSLDWVNLLDAVEITFGLQIGIERSLGLKTVGDLIALVREEPALA
jgi:acyl carrier protein